MEKSSEMWSFYFINHSWNLSINKEKKCKKKLFDQVRYICPVFCGFNHIVLLNILLSVPDFLSLEDWLYLIRIRSKRDWRMHDVEPRKRHCKVMKKNIMLTELSIKPIIEVVKNFQRKPSGYAHASQTQSWVHARLS